MAQTDATWNFMDPSSKDRVLGVLQTEVDGLFDLVADPERWQAPTACEHWEVRDVIGHLVDTTEGYLPAFALARSGGTAQEPHGLRVMAELVDEQAKALRKVPRDELLERLHDDAEPDDGRVPDVVGRRLDRPASCPTTSWGRCRRCSTRSSNWSTTPSTAGTSGRASGSPTGCRATPPTCWCR